MPSWYSLALMKSDCLLHLVPPSKWAIMGLAAVSASIILFAFDPAQHSFYPFCPFHKLTGLSCPGCGCLRAVHQLTHGNLAAALRLNQLLVLALPFLAWALARQIVQELTRKTLPPASIRPSWGWLWLGITVAFTLLRNLPGELFARLWP